MPAHDYSPREALDLLLRNVTARSAALGDRIRTAIDAGKDVQVIDDRSPRKRGRQSPPRYYRKHQPYSDEEALTVALGVLRAHLVETRTFITSAISEFTAVGVAPPKPLQEDEDPHRVERLEHKGEVKAIEIEAEPETVQEKKSLPNQPLELVNAQDLASLRALLAKLGDLANFVET